MCLRKWCFHFPMDRSHPQGKIEQMNVNATRHGHTYARVHMCTHTYMEPTLEILAQGTQGQKPLL